MVRPSDEAQAALDAAGRGGQPLNTFVAPGQSFTRTAAFDTPADATGLALTVTHGEFPGLLIIGDQHSLLHKRTLIPLPDK